MKYTCPMHPEIVEEKEGRCPKCGMKLILQEKASHGAPDQDHNSYKPLIIIVSLIALVTVMLSLKDLNNGIFSISNTVSYFMIGFFLIFSGFKLVDLEGFAQGYFTYDLLAQKWFPYGYIYPFIELFFALAMILGVWEKPILIAEILVMGFSGLGVTIKLLKHEKFQCACLGTFLKVPLTKITLIEDFGMVLLALFLLLF